MNSSTLKDAFKTASPAFFGYISLGIAFGFLFQKSGGAWYFAALMSLFTYAGAAQFVALSLITDHRSLWEIANATFLINLRHIFYGVSFLGKFSRNPIAKSYMIFGLTDESYSILTSTSDQVSVSFRFWVILFAHSFWVIGTLLGGLIGAQLPLDLKFLEFTLPALFVILTIEQAYAVKKIFPFLSAVAGIIFACLINPGSMLFVSLLTITILNIAYFYLSDSFKSTMVAK